MGAVTNTTIDIGEGVEDAELIVDGLYLRTDRIRRPGRRQCTGRNVDHRRREPPNE